jgi:uncharacterized repeat protein (TIGR03803 family)
MTPAGVLTTLYTFDGSDGESPYAGLVQDTNGKLYGTTQYGGASSACQGGCGTVFSLSGDLGPFIEARPTSGEVGETVEILGSDLTGPPELSNCFLHHRARIVPGAILRPRVAGENLQKAQNRHDAPLHRLSVGVVFFFSPKEGGFQSD